MHHTQIEWWLASYMLAIYVVNSFSQDLNAYICCNTLNTLRISGGARDYIQVSQSAQY